MIWTAVLIYQLVSKNQRKVTLTKLYQGKVMLSFSEKNSDLFYICKIKKIK